MRPDTLNRFCRCRRDLPWPKLSGDETCLGVAGAHRLDQGRSHVILSRKKIFARAISPGSAVGARGGRLALFQSSLGSRDPKRLRSRGHLVRFGRGWCLHTSTDVVGVSLPVTFNTFFTKGTHDVHHPLQAHATALPGTCAGIPRQINNLATACLLEAAAENTQRVLEASLQRTLTEFRLFPYASASHHPARSNRIRLAFSRVPRRQTRIGRQTRPHPPHPAPDGHGRPSSSQILGPWNGLILSSAVSLNSRTCVSNNVGLLR